MIVKTEASYRDRRGDPDIRLQLLGTESVIGKRVLDDAGAVVRPGPHTTSAVVSFIRQGQIFYPGATDLAASYGSADAAFEKARERTRTLLAAARPTLRIYGPLVAAFYDNDVPGYAGSRLYYPELIFPNADHRLTVFCVAFDRDLLVAIGAPAGEDAAALRLLRQVREMRRGSKAPLLLPDQTFTVTRIDDAPTLVPIDVTLGSTLAAIVLPT